MNNHDRRGLPHRDDLEPAHLIASVILKNETMVLPGAIYGVLMYVAGIAFVFIARRPVR